MAEVAGNQKQTPVTKPIRKSIKIAARVAQTARFVSLMPTPKDFATRICGDVIYMSGLLQKFVADINKVLDGYSNIPFDYFSNQIYSIVDSANNTLNRAMLYTESMIDNTLGLAGDIVNIGGTTVDISVDLTAGSAAMMSNFGGAVLYTSEQLKGDKESAAKIKEGINKFNNSINPEDRKNALRNAARAVVEAQNKSKGFTEDVMNKASDGVNSAGQFVMDLIKKLKSMVDKMSDDVDKAFGSVIPDKFTNGLGTVANGLQGYDQTMVAQATGAAAGAVQNIIQNFSISKFVTAFLGVATNSVLITTGLNELPPINIDKMLYDLKGDLNEPAIVFEKTNDSQISIDDLIQHDPTKFEKLKESFETELKKERESIFNEKRKATLNRDITSESRMFRSLEESEKRLEENSKMSNGVDKRVYLDLYKGLNKQQRRELNTAINEIRKERERAKRAKQSKKLKDVVVQELKKLKEECNRFAKRLKSEWEAMLKTYKDAIKQITKFFEKDGPGDKYVEDICLDINENCHKIKQLCLVDMPMQLTNSSLKAGLPYCFGMAVPNYLHNIVSFIVDLKVILKFILDLLRYVLNILNDIKKLAQLFLNGLKALQDIINQLMNLFGLGWLIDLVNSIVDLFESTSKNGTEMFEGTLQPICLYQFGKYQEYRKEIETFMNDIKLRENDTNDINKNKDIKINEGIGNINHILRMLGGSVIDLNEKNADGSWKYINYNSTPTFPGSIGSEFFTHTPKKHNEGSENEVYDYNNDEVYQELKRQLSYIKSIEKTYIVAYRSPIFGKTTSPLTEKSIPDPSNVVNWIYYHPNLKHLGYDVDFKPIKDVELKNGNDTILANFKNFNEWWKDTIDYQKEIANGEFKNDKEKEEKEREFIENTTNYYNSLLENVANNFSSHKNWQNENIINVTPTVFHNDGTRTDDKWGYFDIDNNGVITAYELYYWFSHIDPNDWTAIIWPEDAEIEQEATVVNKHMNGSTIRIYDENGNPRTVFVKDAELRTGDYVLVEGKYYRVF